MPSRIKIWLMPTAGVVAATAVLAVRGQEPGSEPRFFPGVHGPNANPAVLANPSFHPTYRAPTDRPRTGGTVPKLTQPVIAGPSGVVTAGGFDPEAARPQPGQDRLSNMPQPKRPGATLPQMTPPQVTIESTAKAPIVAPAAPSLPRGGPQPFSPLPTLVAPGAVPPTLNGPNIASSPLPTSDPLPTQPATPATLGSSNNLPISGTPLNAEPLPVRQTPAVSVEIVAPPSISVGQTFTYEIVVRNGGTTRVSNLRIEDAVPAQATLIGTEPTAETAANRLGWNVDTLEAGAERRFKVSLKPGEEGNMRSRATVSFATAVESRMTVTRPRVSVVMTAPATVRVGEKVPFKITLTNSGTGPAAKVTLRARFGDGLKHPAGQIIEAELTDLPAGGTKTLTLEAVAVASGSASCVLSTTADGNAPETAQTAVTLVEPLLVVKQTGPEKCLVNAQPTFQIELSNPGSAPTDPVNVWAAVPEGFEFLETSDSGGFDKASRTVGWRLPALAAGSSRILTLKLKAASPSAGTMRILAQTAGSEPPAPASTGVVMAAHRPTPAGKPLEARVDAPLKSEGVPALRFQVIDLEDPVLVGQEAVYEVRVMNQGTGPCTGVQLAVELTDGTTAVGAEGPTTGRVSGTQIVFDPITDLAVKAEVVYRLRVRASQAGDSRFRARVSCDQIRTPVIKEESTSFIGQPG